MSSYTRLGSCIWEWEPFTKLDPVSRILWLALYTSAEAKRIVPGLWHGSVTAMAEASKLPVDDTLHALDRLLALEMVEFDQKNRVLRLVLLPDGGESPPNGNVIRGWYKKFKTVPACQVRDAHVATLAWVMNEWSRENDGKPISEKHKEAWAETFAHVVIPPPRRRGVRRLVESSTGNDLQPGLFDSPSQASDAADESANVGGDTVPPPFGPTTDGHSARLQGSDLVSNQISNSETIREPFRNGSDQDQDPDQDPDLDLSFLAEGSGTVGGEIANTHRPRLTLVPMPTPETPPVTDSPLATTTPEGLLIALAHTSAAYRPPLSRDNAQDALCATIRELVAARWGHDEIAEVARWIAKRAVGDPNAPRWYRLSDWAAIPGNVIRALADARTEEHNANSKSAELAEITKQLGYTT